MKVISEALKFEMLVWFKVWSVNYKLVFLDILIISQWVLDFSNPLQYILAFRSIEYYS